MSKQHAECVTKLVEKKLDPKAVGLALHWYAWEVYGNTVEFMFSKTLGNDADDLAKGICDMFNQKCGGAKKPSATHTTTPRVLESKVVKYKVYGDLKAIPLEDELAEARRTIEQLMSKIEQLNCHLGVCMVKPDDEGLENELAECNRIIKRNADKVVEYQRDIDNLREKDASWDCIVTKLRKEKAELTKQLQGVVAQRQAPVSNSGARRVVELEDIIKANSKQIDRMRAESARTISNLKRELEATQKKLQQGVDANRVLKATTESHADTVVCFQSEIECLKKERENSEEGWGKCMHDLNKAKKEYGIGIQKLEATIEQHEGTIKGLEATIEQHEGTIKGLEATIKQLQEGQTKVTDEKLDHGDDYSKLTDRCQEYQVTIKGLEDTIKQNEAEIDKLAAQMLESAKAGDEAHGKYRTYKREWKKVNVNLQELTQEYQKAASDMVKMQKIIVNQNAVIKAMEDKEGQRYASEGSLDPSEDEQNYTAAQTTPRRILAWLGDTVLGQRTPEVKPKVKPEVKPEVSTKVSTLVETSVDSMVYVQMSGAYYHQKWCTLLGGQSATSVTEEEALTKGFNPCSTCFDIDETADKEEGTADDEGETAEEETEAGAADEESQMFRVLPSRMEEDKGKFHNATGNCLQNTGKATKLVPMCELKQTNLEPCLNCCKELFAEWKAAKAAGTNF